MQSSILTAENAKECARGAKRKSVEAGMRRFVYAEKRRSGEAGKRGSENADKRVASPSGELGGAWGNGGLRIEVR